VLVRRLRRPPLLPPLGWRYVQLALPSLHVCRSLLLRLLLQRVPAWLADFYCELPIADEVAAADYARALLAEGVESLADLRACVTVAVLVRALPIVFCRFTSWK
jgi:hypothetical protein